MLSIVARRMTIGLGIALVVGSPFKTTRVHLEE